jgi:hypothetical protein
LAEVRVALALDLAAVRFLADAFLAAVADFLAAVVAWVRLVFA